MKTFAAFLLLYIVSVTATDREYFIGIQEINWDYAPKGKNIISGRNIEEDEHASTFLKQDTNRIGRVYKKASYVQYTDNSYTKEVKKPQWLGFLGPILKANIGDTFTIHLKNFASRPYNLHPHGTEYTKDNEGALYPDRTSQEHKKDDYVKPGESYTYKWDVVVDQGPSNEDDDCITRIYHSHIDGPTDVYSGLVGPIIICKEGVLDKTMENKPKGTKTNPEEFILMFSVVDENLSWYIDENINTYTNSSLVDKEDEDFQESNKMHSINGYMYGNLPGLSVCDNTHVKWYLFGMGNEVDIHSAYFHGQTLTYNYYRVDTLSLFPASMIQASMTTHNPGKWLLSCQVNDHLEGGMQAIYEVRKCTTERLQQSTKKVREYFLAAEEIIWNYGPTSINNFTGQKLDDPDSESATFFEQSDNRIGGSYKKAVYRQYTDATFTVQRPRTREEEHLGILGPLIYAEVGDIINIKFKNKASRPYSIQAHGVSYTKDMEGAAYKTGNDDEDSAEQNSSSHASHVAPGDTITYILEVPLSVDKAALDQNCLPWLYYSSVDVVRDTNSGLVGPLLVCSTAQEHVDYNYFLMPAVLDENKSWYLKDNIDMFTRKPESVDTEDPDFQESNMMHAINGYMYGNQPGLEMCQGNTVHWHMLGLGTEIDMHGLHFVGNNINVRDTVRDVAGLFPHISYSAVMNPDNAGVFSIACMTLDHFSGGMRQHYTVKSCSKQKGTRMNFKVKTYYIAAVEIEWDYSPDRTWEHEWLSHHPESPGDVFLNQSQTSIGSKYKKAVYREYTDKSFTTCKERTKDEEHLGILGPLIIANVGDKIKIVLKNKASRPYSIFAHGIKVASPEGKATDPRNVETYTWIIPERSGPKSEKLCLTWVYYSSVDPVKDPYSGLVGPLVVCKKEVVPTSLPNQNIKHFALLFMIFDENKSWYLDENIQTYCQDPDKVNKEDDGFVESNLMHAVNGYMYSNLKGLTMRVGETVNFHLIGLGNEVDLHTVHFHAHSFEYSKHYVYHSDVFDLYPGAFQTVQMIAKNPGTWLLHCHVADHLHSGMEALYTVEESR